MVVTAAKRLAVYNMLAFPAVIIQIRRKTEKLTLRKLLSHMVQHRGYKLDCKRAEHCMEQKHFPQYET